MTDLLEEMAAATSPRPKGYASIGKGRPINEARPFGIVFKREPTVSHMIEALEKEFVVSDSDEDETYINEPNLFGDIGDDGNAQAGASNASDDRLQPEEYKEAEDSDWTTDEETTGTGSSDKYSVEEESIGYVTGEEGSVLSEVINRAILEASLEDLKIPDDRDLLTMDRTNKRLLLKNTDLSDLRQLQLRKLIDEVDGGSILLDRLDQELRRMGLNALSMLRMMEANDTVISGSFVIPVIGCGWLIPNDLDLFTSTDAFTTVLAYLKKKGYGNCKQVYPQRADQPYRAYTNALQGISIIFEVKNKKSYKINVIVSEGRPIYPILHFHSTPVMNYIAYHGVVCLYDITIYQMGIANYKQDVPRRVAQCYDKYRKRGFEIWEHFEEEHTCKIDGCCPQTIRSLFDKDVVHVRFPCMVDTPAAELRKKEAKLALWRLATAAECKAPTVDEVGFAICDDRFSELKR
ncbi:hypothetical protein H1R20_g15139, partial [Candolleomyces eurysporus]